MKIKFKKIIILYSYKISGFFFGIIFLINLFYPYFIAKDESRPEILIHLFWFFLGIFLGYTIAIYVFKYIYGHPPTSSSLRQK